MKVAHMKAQLTRLGVTERSYAFGGGPERLEEVWNTTYYAKDGTRLYSADETQPFPLTLAQVLRRAKAHERGLNEH